MEFKLIKNKSELKGTCYFEFLPGKYKNKCWNDNSVFISENALCVIEDLLIKSNKNYDHCSFVHYTNNQMEMMKNECIERINRIKNSEDYKLPELYYNEEYYDELNIDDIGKYKDEIIKMIEELVLWMESIKENEITILGI
jgi:hypothetical protein